jgi:UvrD-like helicase C-terminal domain
MGFGELDELVLAYTTTIRKAQGVVIPLTTQHYPMLRRNLVYTGVTRGRRLAVIVGRCCQTKAKQSPLGRGCRTLGYAELPPLLKSCGAVEFEIASS